MDTILSSYKQRRPSVPSTNVMELELRFKDITIDKILELLKTIKDTSIDHTITHFVDAVVYKNKDMKHGNRYFYTDGAVNNTQFYSKEALGLPQMTSCCFGKYSVNLTDENIVPQTLIGRKQDKILFKHRIRVIFPDYNNWGLDITCTRVCDPNPDIVKRSKEEFLNVNNIKDLIESIENTEHCTFAPSVEIEHIPDLDGAGGKQLTAKDIDVISTLPSRLEQRNVIRGGGTADTDVTFQQNVADVAALIEPINTIIRNKKSKAKNLKLLLPQVLGLSLQEYTAMYPPVNYMLTDKANGTRALIYFKKGQKPDSIKGHLFYGGNLSLELQYTGSRSAMKLPLLLDCEYIEEKDLIKGSTPLCLVFDTIVVNNKNFCNTNEGIEERIKLMPIVIDILKKVKVSSSSDQGILFSAKEYRSLEITDRYRQNFNDMYKTAMDYKKDGLILVEKGQPYTTTKSHKWKPSEETTIDFLCKKCPQSLFDTYEQIEGKELYFLYNGINVQLQKNLKIVPHEGYTKIFSEKDLDYGKLIPIQFTMPIVPYAFLFYHTPTGDKVNLDGKIVELVCDTCIMNTEQNNAIVDWKLTRIREDKQAILGIEYGNFYTVAYNTYLTKLEPFPFDSLFEASVLKGQTSYFKNVNTANTIYGPQTSVINYMKSVAISQYANRADSVLDIGSGRGADIYKYMMNNVKHLTVTDKDKPAITELLRRWIGIVKHHSTAVVTSLKAVVFDANDPYTENIDKINTIAKNTKYDVIFCNLAAHYFSSSIDSIRNFINMCKATTEAKAHIVMSVPIGDRIFKLLGSNSEWNAMEDGVVKYSIRKKYVEKTLQSAGQLIELTMPFSQQAYYTEPLYNVDYWKIAFKESGFEFKTISYADSYLEAFKTKNMRNYERLTDNDKLYLSLYGLIVFRRI